MNYQGPCRASNKAEQATMEVTAEFMAMAKANMERGQLEEALFDLDNAICLMPKSVHAHNNRAHALLSLGDYSEGFKEFEWRLLFGDKCFLSDVPMWRGQDIAGKRLLLCHEAGYGDSLMMLRYVPVLKAMGAIITLLMPPGLVRLARQLGIEVSDQFPDDYSIFDYRCPMFSVIPALGHVVNDIPTAPYIKMAGGERLPNSFGIAWSGNREHLRDQHRSVGIEQFLSLFEGNGHSLYNVQNSELDEAAEHGVVTRSFEDLAETAEFMSRLDHIVTVDSAPVHLAGAIGHPSVHLVLPFVCDWRWYNSQAWYPNIKIYRQDSPGDWASAFSKLNKALCDRQG
jgi:hypothetical protein